MRILGIDPGYAIVGYGVIENRRQIPAFGIRRHHHGSRGGFRPAAGGDLPGHERDPHKALSSSSLRGKAVLHQQQDHRYRSGGGQRVILLALAQAGIPLYEYTPMQVKQAVTGYGKALKPQVQEMTRRLLCLEKVPKPDDTADALALAICHGQAAGSPLRRVLLQRGHKPDQVI